MRILTFIATTCLLLSCEDSFKPKSLNITQEQAKEVTVYETDKTPSNLFDWGIFYIKDGSLNLRSDAFPYHLNTPLFSDYAHKFRSIWIPKDSKISIKANGDLNFPTGTIITKTFYYARDDFKNGVLKAKLEDHVHSKGTSIDLKLNHLIETRLLVKQENGWQALPYIWNQDQTNAELEVTGGSIEVVLQGSTKQEFTYMVPDANQCKGCHVSNHTSGILKPIGPKVRHLNLDYDYSPQLTDNQLKQMLARGMINELPKVMTANWDWRKRNLNTVEAARSYLDINCAHCHNPDGPADTSALYLNKENKHKAHLGICKTAVAAGKGTGDRPYDITPGDADKSIIVFRMDSVDPSVAMPELGRATIHEEGVQLIKDWINGLEGDCKIPKS